MRTYLALTFLFFMGISLSAQENEHIKETILTFFEGMETNDTIKIRSTLLKSCTLNSISKNKKGDIVYSEENIPDFFDAVVNAKEFKVKEELLSFDIKIDGEMAMAWTPYKFYINDKFSHCGVNLFTFIKSADDWKIIAITDTRRHSPCN